MPTVSPPHPAGLDDQPLLQQCDIERGRASGPGGQRRNKVETAVRLTHRPTGVTAAASERRQQVRNQGQALFRLRVHLALKVRCRRNLAEEPGERWRARVAGGRIACRPTHRDFPALLAEALDVLYLKRGDFKPAAVLLNVSVSQLVKLLKKEPAALAQVNDQRHQRGQRPLR